ncbi:MAG: hypothetical protein ACRDNS_04365, partial [Trebonia sp.]
MPLEGGNARRTLTVIVRTTDRVVTVARTATTSRRRRSCASALLVGCSRISIRRFLFRRRTCALRAMGRGFAAFLARTRDLAVVFDPRARCLLAGTGIAVIATVEPGGTFVMVTAMVLSRSDPLPTDEAVT